MYFLRGLFCWQDYFLLDNGFDDGNDIKYQDFIIEQAHTACPSHVKIQIWLKNK